jgi:hypothetical protein
MAEHLRDKKFLDAILRATKIVDVETCAVPNLLRNPIEGPAAALSYALMVEVGVEP